MSEFLNLTDVNKSSYMAMTDADADDDEKKAKIHTKYSVLLLSPLIAVSRTYDQFDKR